MNSHPLILTLDQHGVPHRWVSWQHACVYVARDLVAWDAGDTFFTFYGGTNRVTGERSEIATSSIIAIRGKALSGKALHPTPPLSNRELFHRDRHICAYCAREFSSQRLTRDHVLPVSQGGRDTWMNVVTACYLSGPKHSPVHRVSECNPRQYSIFQGRGTRDSYRYGSPVLGMRP